MGASHTHTHHVHQETTKAGNSQWAPQRKSRGPLRQAPIPDHHRNPKKQTRVALRLAMTICLWISSDKMPWPPEPPKTQRKHHFHITNCYCKNQIQKTRPAQHPPQPPACLQVKGRNHLGHQIHPNPNENIVFIQETVIAKIRFKKQD